MCARRHRPSPDPRQPDLGPAPLPAPMPRRHPGPAPTAPPSPTRCSRLPASLYVAIEQIQNRRLGCCRREVLRASPPSRLPRASPPSRPPPAAARVPLSRCVGPGALAGKNRTACIPFSPNARKSPPFLATSARNACFSRSRWQHLRPMHPFPGAIGRFRMHGARILPPRALFRVEEPEITHDAKVLPAPPGLSAAAACGPAEWALRHAAAACDTRHGRTGFAPCGAGLACLPHARPLPSRLCPPPPAFIAAVLHASRFAARIAPTAPRHPPRRPLRSG